MTKTFFKSYTNNHVANADIDGVTTMTNATINKEDDTRYQNFDFILSNPDNKFNNNFILDSIDLSQNICQGYDVALVKFNYDNDTLLASRRKKRTNTKNNTLYRTINLQIKPDSFTFNLIDFILINFVNLKKYSDPIASTIFNLHISISFYDTDIKDKSLPLKIKVIENFKLANLNDLNKLNSLLTNFQLECESIIPNKIMDDNQQLSVFQYKFTIDHINTADDSILKTIFLLNQINLNKSFEIDKFHRDKNNTNTIEYKLIKPIIEETLQSINNPDNLNFYFVGNGLSNNLNLQTFINKNCLETRPNKLKSMRELYFEKNYNFLFGEEREFRRASDNLYLRLNNIDKQLNWGKENNINSKVDSKEQGQSDVAKTSIEKIIQLENENFELRDTLHQLIISDNKDKKTDDTSDVIDKSNVPMGGITKSKNDFNEIDTPTRSILWDKLSKLLETKLELSKVNLEQSVLLNKIELITSLNKINKTNETNQLDFINNQQLEINKILSINNKLCDDINDMDTQINNNFNVLSNLNSQLFRKENRKKRQSRRKSSIISATTSLDSSSTDNSLFDLYEDDGSTNTDSDCRKNSTTTNSSVPRSFSLNSSVSVASSTKGFKLKILKADL